MKIVNRDQWFEVKQLGDGIRLIHEPFIRPFYRCNLWHVQGRDKDLLLDSGSGLVSLREQLPWLTERPLVAVASHCHFDHIAGHHEFPERLVHPAEADILAAPNGENDLSKAFVGDDMFEAHPDCPLCYAEYRVKAAPATGMIEDGDVLDLGNRVLQVIHTPGHSPGGICLYEAASETLFSGDIIYDGPLVEDAYHSDPDDYARSLQRLQALPVRTVHGGHFGSFSGQHLRIIIDQWQRSHDEACCTQHQEAHHRDKDRNPPRRVVMNSAVVRAVVHRHISRLLGGRNDFDDNTSLAQLGLDREDIEELLFHLEDELQVTAFTAEEDRMLESARTVSDLSRFLLEIGQVRQA